MHIIIAGAGVVGTSLAEQLSRENHDIVLIEADRNRAATISDSLDILCIQGSASSPGILHRAGIRSADVLIAVTESDEVNLVVCAIGKSMGVPQRIARLRNSEFTDPKHGFDLDNIGAMHTINPEPIVVDSMIRSVELPGVEEVTSIADGKLQILRFTVREDSPIANRVLNEIKTIGALDGFLILEISRGDKTFVPDGSDRVEPHDHLQVLTTNDMVEFLLPIIHKHPKVPTHAIIYGASRIGLSLCQRLESKLKVTLIEPDLERARDASELLEETTVLHGEATDLSLLGEAALDLCDLYCSVSDNDQSNMLAALLAKKHATLQAGVLVHQPEFLPILDSLGIESVLSPRLTTVGAILSLVRRGAVHSVTPMGHSHAELLELELPITSKLVDKRLEEVKFPKGSLVASIINDDLVVIASGKSVLRAGDRVFVYAQPGALGGIQKLFLRG